MIRTLCSALALLGLGGIAAAQTVSVRTPGSTRLSLDGPVQHYRLHYASHTLTRLDDPQEIPLVKQAASTPTYLNDCSVNSFIGSATSEFIDWGTKAGGVSTIVDSFSFGYATNAPDLSIGGAGATVEVAFYTGTTGFGVLGTEAARFSLTGLPGSTTGGFAGFFLTVDLSGTPGFCLPDGPIGYGYCSADLVNTTGPILVDVTDPGCSTGAIDAFDDFTCPASDAGAVYNGTFNLATPNIASFFMVINEDDATEVATTAVNNGGGSNPLLASDGGVPAVLGATWPVTIDNSAGFNTTIGPWTVGSLAPGTFVTGGEIIVNILDPNGFVISNSVVGAPVGLVDHSVFVVKDLTLIGVDLTFQGLLFGGITPFQLTNGIDIHLGF